MIDTHCHLTDPRLHVQLDEVLRRASQAGVERIVTIGTDPEDSAACIELCRHRLDVRCVIGLHPNYVKGPIGTTPAAFIPYIRSMQNDPVVVALGEMGLDYHYSKKPDDLSFQHSAFEQQMQIAMEVGKPVVIHCREAVNDTLAVMKSFPTVPAVFHCFTGTIDEARRILNAGYLLGFTGVITFKTNDELREVVKLTPMDRMLVETDAPYLTPEPMRKIKTNEPSFVMHTAGVVARVKGVSVEEIDRITTENALRFYRWE